MEFDWNELKKEYVTDHACTYVKLAKKHGLSRTAVATRGKAENWRKLREEYATKAFEKKLNKVADRQAERYARLLDVTDKLLTLVENAVDSTAEDSTTENAPPIDKQWFRQIAGTLKDIKDVQDCKSKLDLREQEARIKALEKQSRDDDKLTEITVKIADDVKDYAE